MDPPLLIREAAWEPSATMCAQNPLKFQAVFDNEMGSGKSLLLSAPTVLPQSTGL